MLTTAIGTGQIAGHATAAWLAERSHGFALPMLVAAGVTALAPGAILLHRRDPGRAPARTGAHAARQLPWSADSAQRRERHALRSRAQSSRRHDFGGSTVTLNTCLTPFECRAAHGSDTSSAAPGAAQRLLERTC
jgi:hypothetical protein